MNIQNHTYISNHPDIDECSDGTHDCSQTCTNTIASYTCGCNTRYILVLGTDGITCIGMCTCTYRNLFMHVTITRKHVDLTYIYIYFVSSRY